MVVGRYMVYKLPNHTAMKRGCLYLINKRDARLLVSMRLQSDQTINVLTITPQNDVGHVVKITKNHKER